MNMVTVSGSINVSLLQIFSFIVRGIMGRQFMSPLEKQLEVFEDVRTPILKKLNTTSSVSISYKAISLIL